MPALFALIQQIPSRRYVGVWNDLTVEEQFGLPTGMGEAPAAGAPGFMASA